MRKMLSTFTVILVCSFLLCNCASPSNVKVKIKEAPEIEFVEALKSKSTVTMLTNNDAELGYLFLGEDLLSPSFNKEVYKIDGVNFELNEPLSKIFSDNKAIRPLYLNQSGLLYTSNSLKNNIDEETLSCIKNNELVQVYRRYSNWTNNEYILIQTDEYKYEIKNLATDQTVEFISDLDVFSIKPIKDGFLYAYVDEEKNSDFIDTAKEDGELSISTASAYKNMFSHLGLFMNYKIYNSEMLNPIDLESPKSTYTEPTFIAVEFRKSDKKSGEEDFQPYEVMGPMEKPITSKASNIILWVDKNNNTVHLQDASPTIKNNETSKITSFTVEGTTIDHVETCTNSDGSVKWCIIQESSKEKHIVEIACSSNETRTTNYILPDYCIFPQFLSYDENGNFVIIYWRKDLYNYQLGILKDNSREMIVRNIKLPNTVKNVQGQQFKLLGSLKNTYWFEFIDPNFDRTKTDKNVHILSSTVK